MGETSLTSRDLSPESEFWPCEVFYCCEVDPAAVRVSGRWIPVELWCGSCSLNLEGVKVLAQCRGCRSGEEKDLAEGFPAPNLHHTGEPHTAGWTTEWVGVPGGGSGAWGLLPGHVLSREVLGPVVV